MQNIPEKIGVVAVTRQQVKGKGIIIVKPMTNYYVNLLHVGLPVATSPQMCSPFLVQYLL